MSVIRIIGFVMVIVGAVWTFQGLGFIKGSFMTGDPLWAIIGPAVAGIGLGIVAARRPKA